MLGIRWAEAYIRENILLRPYYGGVVWLPMVTCSGSKRNMSRGDSSSDELELSSVLGDTRAYLHSPVWG